MHSKTGVAFPWMIWRTIGTEWDKHPSGFARQWRVAMVKIGQVRPVSDDPDEALREVIQSQPDEGVVSQLLRDAHLIEAALEYDQRVASLDQKVRGHFRSKSRELTSFPLDILSPSRNNT
jgi:hypothetical protein